MHGFGSVSDRILREKAYTYEVVTPATTPAVTLTELKEYSKIFIDVEDTTLQIILDSALEFGQAYTRRVFTTTEFKTFRDEFITRSNFIELRKSKFIAISTNGFRYFNESNVLVDVDSSIFMTTNQSDYSKIALLNNEDWPSDLSEDRPFQNVEITFTAGFGTSADDVPDGLKIAVMQHALDMIKNRGDCSDCTCNITNLPAAAKTLYDKFKIMELRLGF